MGIVILVGALSGVSNIPQGLREAQPAPLMLKAGEQTAKVASSLFAQAADGGNWYRKLGPCALAVFGMTRRLSTCEAAGSRRGALARHESCLCEEP
jgi:hypothetical protein